MLKTNLMYTIEFIVQEIFCTIALQYIACLSTDGDDVLVITTVHLFSQAAAVPRDKTGAYH